MRKPSMKDVLQEVVVVSAFLASAGHIYSVAHDMGNHPVIAGVHALGVDGLVYIGIGAFREGAKVRGALAVGYGGAVSLAFNFAAYSGGRLPSWAIAASMPIVLVLAVLVAGHGVPRKVSQQDTAPVRKRVPVSRPVSRDVPAETSLPEGDARLGTAVVPPVPAVPALSDNDKRTKAFRMLDEGRTKPEVAAAVGTTIRTLNRWLSQR